MNVKNMHLEATLPDDAVDNTARKQIMHLEGGAGMKKRRIQYGDHSAQSMRGRERRLHKSVPRQIGSKHMHAITRTMTLLETDNGMLDTQTLNKIDTRMSHSFVPREQSPRVP